MKQFHLNGRELTLTVKRAPLFIRGMLFLFAFLSFIMPLVGMILYMAFGFGFHFGFLIGLFIFGLLGFYLLRVALWNTFGKEILVFSKGQISYIADYGWFRDGKKQKEILGTVSYSIRQLGYEDDYTGSLVIE